MNECSISGRKLEREQKLFKIKEKQFKKDPGKCKRVDGDARKQNEAV